ncbi:hypothetical protein [Formosa sp. A9]|uniref:hypothetical protein n=1 Tax=Formosa sp. A9 TaxID=3442641 RepID=UPI003EB7E568
MGYLSPEIEAWFKKSKEASLVKPGVSCGIFQDLDASQSPETFKKQSRTKHQTKDL